MTNNDILRRLRYTFDINDDRMILLFAQGGKIVTRAEISSWMKKDDDEDYKALTDFDFSTFLNGFIVEKRGKKDGADPVPEKHLNNNIIFRKLKIALNYTDDIILEIFDRAELRISKGELSALFRHPDHKHFRPCKDQFLRNFLMGLQLKLKGSKEDDGQ